MKQENLNPKVASYDNWDKEHKYGYAKPSNNQSIEEIDLDSAVFQEQGQTIYTLGDYKNNGSNGVSDGNFATTLYRVAVDSGYSVEELVKYNKQLNPDIDWNHPEQLQIGTKIYIPNSEDISETNKTHNLQEQQERLVTPTEGDNISIKKTIKINNKEKILNDYEKLDSGDLKIRKNGVNIVYSQDKNKNWHQYIEGKQLDDYEVSSSGQIYKLENGIVKVISQNENGDWNEDELHYPDQFSWNQEELSKILNPISTETSKSNNVK